MMLDVVVHPIGRQQRAGEDIGLRRARIAVGIVIVRHDRMQHFVIQDVLEEPKRHEALIEPGIDTNDAIFFLDRPENKIFFRTFSAFTAPNHFVSAKTVTEMTRVQFVEETAQIEITAFGIEPELLLERQS